MLENDFLRDKFNEIEILKGKLITYPKECSKDIIIQIDMLCNEVWGHIEEKKKKKHKDKEDGKEKNKCEYKEKDKWEYKDKDKCEHKGKEKCEYKDEDKEKGKCKSKEKSKCQDKYDDYKKESDHKHEMNKSCKKEKYDKHCYDKKDHDKKDYEVLDKFKKIYTGECEICKHKEKRINNLMRMIEDELEEVEFESEDNDEMELENLKNENDEIVWSREMLKDLSEDKEILFEKTKKKE